MDQPEYIFHFSDIRDGLCTVRFTNCCTGEAHEFCAAVDDRQFVLLKLPRMPAVLADLVDLALAVYVADRTLRRCIDAICHIHVHLPIRHPEIFTSSHIIEDLEGLLYRYTGDRWTFEFTQRVAHGRLAERQLCLPTVMSLGSSVEVALWSGGLDALAGLYNRMQDLESAQRYTLVGAGGNFHVHNIQRRVAMAVDECFPWPSRLVQAPIRLYGTDGMSKNSVPRSRGLVFLLLGTACAYMEGQNQLFVYENGIGSLNLPFRSSEVGLDRSRAVHPLSLKQVSQLVSQVLGQPFSYRNPFLFWTKAQMCDRLVRSNLTEAVGLTVTCDRRHRAIPMECGRCSSCLLRRQALAFHGVVEDASRYVATHAQAPRRSSDSLHLRAMLYQVTWLRSCLASSDPWHTLARKYHDLLDVADHVASRERLPIVTVRHLLLRLYENYVLEWETVWHTIGQGLLSAAELPAA